MSTARYLVGDVFERLAEIPDGSIDFALTSPPFLALRSYLPDGHPDKHKEIGSEPSPAEFIDTMLALTAELGRVLAPHGSIAIEIGDTYAGSGGAGGDYNADGMREGQERFDGAAALRRGSASKSRGRGPKGGDDSVDVRPAPAYGPGWPLDKSLCGIPTLYTWSLAYGRNLLTGEPSPAGMWRVRNLKPWIRSNPPVGALGDKERPATSYITVATRARVRYFDLDAVRTSPTSGAPGEQLAASRAVMGYAGRDKPGAPGASTQPQTASHPAGAPPLDWWHHVDAVLDAELDQHAPGVRFAGNKSNSKGLVRPPGKDSGDEPRATDAGYPTGARGVHLRRALERAGILTTVDALDVSPKGYAGSHYAVWPKELVKLLVAEMCPYKVCTTCGHPSRRIVDKEPSPNEGNWYHQGQDGGSSTGGTARTTRRATTTGWTDCGHGTWRPGVVLDPFAGSGTTLAVCTGMARDAIGIDLDERGAELARERVGMFLEVDYGRQEPRVPD